MKKLRDGTVDPATGGVYRRIETKDPATGATYIWEGIHLRVEGNEEVFDPPLKKKPPRRPQKKRPRSRRKKKS